MTPAKVAIDARDYGRARALLDLIASAKREASPVLVLASTPAQRHRRG
jgi:hypothetical protein